VERARFRRLVQDALRSLPRELSDKLENVEVVIRREPSASDLREAGLESGEQLFGLYVGTPRTERGDYQLALPDRIVIYQASLERAVHPRDIPREVATTVVHELGHHFGLDDNRLGELGVG
jgi:predicted Zn-dependent protease with MMP-like domain